MGNFLTRKKDPPFKKERINRNLLREISQILPQQGTGSSKNNSEKGRVICLTGFIQEKGKVSKVPRRMSSEYQTLSRAQAFFKTELAFR